MLADVDDVMMGGEEEAHLSPAQWLVLVSCAWAADRMGVVRCSQHEIAARWGLSMGTVKAALAHLCGEKVLTETAEGKAWAIVRPAYLEHISRGLYQYLRSDAAEPEPTARAATWRRTWKRHTRNADRPTRSNDDDAGKREVEVQVQPSSWDD